MITFLGTCSREVTIIGSIPKAVKVAVNDNVFREAHKLELLKNDIQTTK